MYEMNETAKLQRILKDLQSMKTDGDSEITITSWARVLAALRQLKSWRFMHCKFSFTLLKRILRSYIKYWTRPCLFAEVSLTGFAVNEVNAFSEKDLEFILIFKIQVAQGQINGTFHSSQYTGQKTAT
jgi:hypothetical protein